MLSRMMHGAVWRRASLVGLAVVTVVAITPSAAAASGPVLQAFPLPASVSLPTGAMQDALVAGPDGQEWFAVDPGTDNADYRLVEVDSSGTFTVLPANLGNAGEATGVGELIADGDSVFALSGGNFVASIDAAGQIESETTTTGIDMALGPDGDLYLTEGTHGVIGRLVPGQDTVTTLGTPAASPDGIVTVGDQLFFSDSETDALYRLSTDGTSQQDDAVTVGPAPHAMTGGPDGDLWTVGQGVNGLPGTSIERVDPATGDLLATDTPPDSDYVLSLTAGPDGRLWFPEAGLIHAIGALDPATGVFSTYPLPAGFNVTVTQNENADNNPPVTDASTIAPGPDATLWVTGATTSGAPAILEISNLTGPAGTTAPAPTRSPTAAAPGARRSRVEVRVAGSVTSRRLLALWLTCAGAQTCRGRVTLSVAEAVTVHRHGRRLMRRETRELGGMSFRVAAGRRSLLHLRLSRRAMRLIEHARHGRLDVMLRIVARGGDRTIHVQLRAPRRR